ncbi:hypothetical protein ACH5RR_009292 [Cinchona calisaya]|uniref:Uncharacterized protein n=1 Tax=Cinchona calisaya TaxID=153742 RepID=A0ABD3ADR6_9GENT
MIEGLYATVTVGEGVTVGGAVKESWTAGERLDNKEGGEGMKIVPTAPPTAPPTAKPAVTLAKQSFIQCVTYNARDNANRDGAANDEDTSFDERGFAGFSNYYSDDHFEYENENEEPPIFKCSMKDHHNLHEG